MSELGPNPSGICMCGCGRTTPISTVTRTAKGDVRGTHRRFAAPGCASRYHARFTNPLRFWEKFDARWEKAPRGCWEWRGYISPEGYGRFARCLYAHRVSYERHVGTIPEGLDIDHLCRNRACINPAHLEPVSRRINWLRGMNHSAISTRTNTCQRGHEYTPENTYVRPDGAGRMCRTCSALRAQRRRSLREAS